LVKESEKNLLIDYLRNRQDYCNYIAMKNKTLIYSLIICATLTLLACSKDEDNGAGTGENADISYHRISGTTALGRPGSWATNCLDEACAGSNAEGFYLLSAQTNSSTLMFSDIPEADGTTVRLYSRYRHDAEVTSSLVNFNPSTHAILDAWSTLNQQSSIEECAVDVSCPTALLSGFTPDVEATMVSQVAAIMGPMWPEGRNPFSDVYIADPNPASPSYDALDRLHDYFHFEVSGEYWLVLDNQGNELSRTPLDSLLNDNPNTLVPLTEIQLQESVELPIPPAPARNPISLVYSTTPSLANSIDPPLLFEVDSSRSRSDNPGELTITHEVTDPDGFRETYNGAVAATTLELPGNYIWLITVADAANYSLTRGFVIQVAAIEGAAPVFGGAGSCFTPAPLSVNSLNTCMETQNGGAFGVCEPVNSGSIHTQYSPAPCANEVQNEGALFGTCTIVTSELKLFFYDNPERPNNADSFERKQQDTATLCTLFFEGEWSNTP
jgi:hypothetical protein